MIAAMILRALRGIMHTKSGRVKAHRRLERRAAARRGLEGDARDAAEDGAAQPATRHAAAEGVRDLDAKAHAGSGRGPGFAR